MKSQKSPIVDKKSLMRIFSIPEKSSSKLIQLEKKISKDIIGFLKSNIIAGDLSSNEIEKTFNDAKIPENPIFVSQQVDFLLEKLVSQSVHTSSPSFIGHMTSATPYFILPLTKIMVALNQNLVKTETSKAFTPLERQVLAMIHRLIYNKKKAYYDLYTQHKNYALGAFCSGGTIANITAMWVARNKLLGPSKDFPGVYKTGIFAAIKYYKYNDLAILVSKRAHYSIYKAADILGFGKSNIITLDIDKDEKISIKNLENKIIECKNKKIGIVAIIGIAGSTETGSVDDLSKMADIAKKFNIFFHIDAAWGGPTLFSDKYKYILKGIEKADSVTIDAHKQLYIPIGAGLVIFQNQKSLSEIKYSASYTIRDKSKDLGKFTLEGSRPAVAMLVHSALQIMGKKGYELLINDGIEKAKIFANIIEEHKDFEIITYPVLNILTYRYNPWKGLKEDKFLNNINKNIQKIQRANGKTFVSRTSLNINKKKIIVFRVVLANPLTNKNILKNILIEQSNIAKKMRFSRKDS